ncbi:hypothetical protein [Pseudomonas fluorescens]|uniref:hypothetical protein n=1 Tax=Pseudomonas fluorescens TaxID=294 RepID=UPI000ACA7E34|nr:hypothetical protein [Pseudomonas fluorescens]
MSALDMQAWIDDYERCDISGQPAPPSSLQLAAGWKRQHSDGGRYWSATVYRRQ